jgi:predicted DNA-binding transcriptional regulator YafY
MAKKRTTRPTPASGAVTAERAARLYRLLQLLADGPQSRGMLARRLRLDVRGFYRDLELLRAAGINLPLVDGKYTLEEDVDRAVDRLPFPDPLLTLGEARALAKGRSRAHRKLRGQVDQIMGRTAKRRAKRKR